MKHISQSQILFSRYCCGSANTLVSEGLNLQSKNLRSLRRTQPYPFDAKYEIS
jgi:hypothetical protein